MKIYVIRLLTTLLALLLLVTATACSPADRGLETDSAAEDSTTASSDTSAPTEEKTEGESENKTPDFTVLDGEGNSVKLSDFFGKPIVLNFWASWCPPCKAELPDFEDAYKKYDGEVVFLMVNMTDNQMETVEVAKDFIKTHGYTFPVYYDVNYQAATVYGIRSIPQTYFINAEGEAVASATGMISAAQLEQGIGMIYSK
ncbi:MAG: TlpA family protein disulfide reductase [Clostridia bacterium]|nr:TlpA family protein disulfide reductase [Clostridia bacterium]